MDQLTTADFLPKWTVEDEEDAQEISKASLKDKILGVLGGIGKPGPG